MAKTIHYLSFASIVLVALFIFTVDSFNVAINRVAINRLKIINKGIHGRVTQTNSLRRKHTPSVPLVKNFATVNNENEVVENVDDSIFGSRLLPQYKNMKQGKLDNGFTYIIFPNATPEGRFEAHLEVLSGSANELERQQGMAHLLEHVVYMGSPKRQLISGTGSRTNAYTDFHHTVFFAACPTTTPDQFWKKPMLPMALDALLDVMTTGIDENRLEKERAAVLSEASMVNKMEYRVECQILSSLHQENRISTRFPIGKTNLIENWTKEDLQLYHSTHYRPDNVVLYIVGDVNIDEAEQVIKQKFGNLSPKFDAAKLLKESGEFPDISMRSVNRHFPPVIHKWSCSDELVKFNNIPEGLIKPSELNGRVSTLNDIPSDGSKIVLPDTKLFRHELLQGFSFHIFAKRPIEPIVTELNLKRELMRRMVLSALQIRLNVEQRQEPLFTFVDFNQVNWPREACAVCSLDLTTDLSMWRKAVVVAVQEIRRLGLFGLTQSEVDRYKKAILTETAQSVAQAQQMNNEDVLAELMDAEANGHTYIDPIERFEIVQNVVESITTQDVANIAKELCEHLSHIQAETGVKPAAVVACAPIADRGGDECVISEEDIADAVQEAINAPLEALENSEVPTTLITDAQLAEKKEIQPPSWKPLDGKALKDEGARNTLGIVQKKLNNGIRVNLRSLDTEPQRAALRMLVPGGRLLEGNSPGSVLIGARTLQEGGAFLSMTREDVELFCIDHMVMVDIIAAEDALIFDFQTVTTPGLGGKVTGLEAVLQVAHIILTDFKFEDDAFLRAQQTFHEQFDSIVKGLESACQESLTYSLTGGDSRFLAPNHKQIDALDLPTVKDAVISQLDPENIEISISGDVPVEVLEQYCLDYFGTVPPKKKNKLLKKISFSNKESLKVKTLGRSQQLGVYLPDSDERAMGYLAGPAPNRWGIYSSGETIGDFMQAKTGKKESRRDHPLFGNLALQILQEVANRRLFSVVREERQLTYDASFSLQALESVNGGWYMVSVTASPAQVQEAVRACKEALSSLRGPFGVKGDSIQSAKRTILHRFSSAAVSNLFWVDNMSGTQVNDIPNKSLKSIIEFQEVLNSVTLQDIQLLVELFDFNEDSMTSCVGVTSPSPPADMNVQK